MSGANANVTPKPAISASAPNSRSESRGNSIVQRVTRAESAAATSPHLPAPSTTAATPRPPSKKAKRLAAVSRRAIGSSGKRKEKAGRGEGAQGAKRVGGGG